VEPNKQERPGFAPAPIPSASEIRRLCLEIQAGWSDRERRSRAGFYGSRQPIEIQHFDDAGDCDALA